MFQNELGKGRRDMREAEVMGKTEGGVAMEIRTIKKFECRKELSSLSDEKPIGMYSFYNDNGKYIGSIGDFGKLVIERGIEPETYDDNKVCSIGKSTKDGKWYGWSHRAIFGFKVGDIVKAGSCCATSGWTEEYLKDHPDTRVLPVGFEAKTEEDCKKMAIAFASSVA